MKLNINYESGFSLIEVLASMLVISIGLLGILGLFINGVKTTDEAYLRSQAVLLAYDLADRIRANPSASADYYLTASATLITPSNDCISQICSTTQLAEADLYDWKNQVTDTLPLGDAAVIDVAPDTLITIGWDHLGISESFSMVMR